MKRVAAVLMALCMLVLTTAAAYAQTTFQKYDPPITIQVGRSIDPNWKYPSGDDIENNIWYRDYLDRLGIQVQHAWTALSSEYNNKLNVVIASGDIPDLFYCSANQLKTLIEADMVTDLTDVLEEYGSDYLKSMLAGDGGLALDSASADGRLYAIPSMYATVYDPDLLWVRQDWLDELGLKAPTTIEEVEAVAKAFKEKDPDGNGQADTFGLAVCNSLVNTGIVSLTGFFNGFHAYPDTWLKMEDGSVTYGSLQPEMKTALAKLNEMYKAGLIDPEFAVKDSAKVGEEEAGGKIGLSYGRNWNVYVFGSGLADQPDMIWTPVAAPSAEDVQSKANVGFGVGGYYVVRKGYEHPEAAIEMLNQMVEIIYGNRRNEPDFITVWVDGQTIQQNHLNVIQTTPSNNYTSEAMRKVVQAVEKRDPSLLEGLVTETDKYEPTVKYLDGGDNTFFMQAHQVKAFKVLAEQYPEERLVPTVFGGLTDTMAEKMGILSAYQTEMFTKIIMGEEPVDAFDTYVAKWLEMGGQQIIDEVNAWMAD